ncbi:hypothetical protein MAP00_001225 [Monascus purpureus]|nr:hypothetical protein MAP00_001225 [Monascus purpureus]
MPHPVEYYFADADRCDRSLPSRRKIRRTRIQRTERSRGRQLERSDTTTRTTPREPRGYLAPELAAGKHISFTVGFSVRSRDLDKKRSAPSSDFGFGCLFSQRLIILQLSCA